VPRVFGLSRTNPRVDGSTLSARATFPGFVRYVKTLVMRLWSHLLTFAPLAEPGLNAALTRS